MSGLCCQLTRAREQNKAFAQHTMQCMRWTALAVVYDMQVPPSGAFAWRPNSVLVKATKAKTDGWQLAGMVQYDAWGQPAFLHRWAEGYGLSETIV